MWAHGVPGACDRRLGGPHLVKVIASGEPRELANASAHERVAAATVIDLNDTYPVANKRRDPYAAEWRRFVSTHLSRRCPVRDHATQMPVCGSIGARRPRNIQGPTRWSYDGRQLAFS